MHTEFSPAYDEYHTRTGMFLPRLLPASKATVPAQSQYKNAAGLEV